MSPTGQPPLTIKQVRARHPWPWSYMTDVHAVVHVLDAENKVVPMFVLLDFVCDVTRQAGQAQEAKPESAA